MRGAPAVLGRLVLILGVVAALFGPSAATLWVSTPDASDIQARVAALTSSYGVPLLAEDEVPSQLA